MLLKLLLLLLKNDLNGTLSLRNHTVYYRSWLKNDKYTLFSNGLTNGHFESLRTELTIIEEVLVTGNIVSNVVLCLPATIKRESGSKFNLDQFF